MECTLVLIFWENPWELKILIRYDAKNCKEKRCFTAEKLYRKRSRGAQQSSQKFQSDSHNPCQCVRACFWLPVGGLLAWNKDCTPHARACGEGTYDAWDKNVILAYISISVRREDYGSLFFLICYPSLSFCYYLSNSWRSYTTYQFYILIFFLRPI